MWHPLFLSSFSISTFYGVRLCLQSSPLRRFHHHHHGGKANKRSIVIVQVISQTNEVRFKSHLDGRAHTRTAVWLRHGPVEIRKLWQDDCNTQI